jgi:hypothetical protein
MADPTSLFAKAKTFKFFGRELTQLVTNCSLKTSLKKETLEKKSEIFFSKPDVIAIVWLFHFSRKNSNIMKKI